MKLPCCRQPSRRHCPVKGIEIKSGEHATVRENKPSEVVPLGVFPKVVRQNVHPERRRLSTANREVDARAATATAAAHAGLLKLRQERGGVRFAVLQHPTDKQPLRIRERTIFRNVSFRMIARHEV